MRRDGASPGGETGRLPPEPTRFMEARREPFDRIIILIVRYDPLRERSTMNAFDAQADAQPRALRSASWIDDGGKNGFIARHHLRAMGLGPAQFDGRPIVGIASTWSELVPCNANLRELAQHVRRGITRAGGVALEFPVMSLSEPLMRPTSMIYRNLAAIEFEEDIRAHPLDAVVLLTGCDKTTPAALMGAASADVPAIVATSGPMLNGKYRGRDVGSGTDIWKMSEDLRAGVVSQAAATSSACSCFRES